MKLSAVLVACATVLPLCLPAYAAAPLTPAQQAEQAARRYLADYAQRQHLLEPDITVQALPPSRPLPPCSAPYSIEPADTRFLARLRFAARCPGSPAASELIIRADLSAKVLVAAADLPAGKPIDPAAVTLEKRSLATAPDALASPDDVAGLASRRLLRAGQIVQKRFLQPLQLVQRGQSVRIVARSQGIEVNVPGEALQNGGEGDLIRVRNVTSGHIISARVIGPGSVAPGDAVGGE